MPILYSVTIYILSLYIHAPTSHDSSIAWPSPVSPVQPAARAPLCIANIPSIILRATPNNPIQYPALVQSIDRSTYYPIYIANRNQKKRTPLPGSIPEPGTPHTHTPPDRSPAGMQGIHIYIHTYMHTHVRAWIYIHKGEWWWPHAPCRTHIISISSYHIHIISYP